MKNRRGVAVFFIMTLGVLTFATIIGNVAYELSQITPEDIGSFFRRIADGYNNEA